MKMEMEQKAKELHQPSEGAEESKEEGKREDELPPEFF